MSVMLIGLYPIKSHLVPSLPTLLSSSVTSSVLSSFILLLFLITIIFFSRLNFPSFLFHFFPLLFPHSRSSSHLSISLLMTPLFFSSLSHLFLFFSFLFFSFLFFSFPDSSFLFFSFSSSLSYLSSQFIGGLTRIEIGGTQFRWDLLVTITNLISNNDFLLSDITIDPPKLSLLSVTPEIGITYNIQGRNTFDVTYARAKLNLAIISGEFGSKIHSSNGASVTVTGQFYNSTPIVSPSSGTGSPGKHLTTVE